MGGLGNQMFQYAAARALAIEKKTWVYLDPSFLYEDAKGRWTQREYELGVFNVQYKFEKSGRINFLRRLNHSARWRKWQEQSWWPFSFRNFNEPDSRYHSELFSLPRNVYMQGYFQSEKYFVKHADQLRKDFSLLEEPGERNQLTLAEIRNTNAVSIHVRRGDYETLAAAKAFHGTLSPAYYHAAAKKMEEFVSEPITWYIFSDDAAWAARNLQLNGRAVVVDWNQGKQSAEDLRLMSNCRHHIIANSSFSWWGAWLNPSGDKNVITPSRWFADQKMDDSDIVPAGWIRMSEGPLA